jgi:glutamate synthase (NADPH/NADH) large chain
LADWSGQQRHFAKVMPRDYKRVLQAIAEAERDGVDVDKAIMAAAHG